MKREPKFELQRITGMRMKYAPGIYKQKEIQRESMAFREKVNRDLHQNQRG